MIKWIYCAIWAGTFAYSLLDPLILNTIIQEFSEKHMGFQKIRRTGTKFRALRGDYPKKEKPDLHCR